MNYFIQVSLSIECALMGILSSCGTQPLCKSQLCDLVPAWKGVRTGPSEEMSRVVMNLDFRIADILVCAAVYHLGDLGLKYLIF